MNEIKPYEIPAEPAQANVTGRDGCTRQVSVLNIDPRAIAKEHELDESLENLVGQIVLRINGSFAMGAEPICIQIILTLIAAHLQTQFANELKFGRR
jgi:hypothetical protein